MTNPRTPVPIPAVAALAVVVLLAACTGSTSHPADTHTASSSPMRAPGSAARTHVVLPEAKGAHGVAVRTFTGSAARRAINEFTSAREPKLLRTGHVTTVRFSEELARNAPLSGISASVANTTLADCPQPFLTRPAHKYTLTCSVTPLSNRSPVVFHVRDLDPRTGKPDGSSATFKLIPTKKQ